MLATNTIVVGAVKSCLNIGIRGKLIGHEWHEWVETPGGLLKFVDTKGDNDANAKKV